MILFHFYSNYHDEKGSSYGWKRKSTHKDHRRERHTAESEQSGPSLSDRKNREGSVLPDPAEYFKSFERHRTALHIRTLEDARLIITETQPGLHGSMRVCICSIQSFLLETFEAEADKVNNAVTLDMPVGNYHDFHVEPTCGLADENGILGAFDDIRPFYSPLRTRAQLLWFQQGFVEYRFPNLTNPLLELQELAFQMELCSEAPGFLEEWPSDITVSVNGREAATYHSPGDFGSRRGRLTPASWCNGRTQYGLLKTFSVKRDGSYLDGLPVDSEVTLESLNLSAHPYITLRVEVKKEADHVGGVNIFGEKYGDFPQGILMSLTY